MSKKKTRRGKRGGLKHQEAQCNAHLMQITGRKAVKAAEECERLYQAILSELEKDEDEYHLNIKKELITTQELWSAYLERSVDAQETIYGGGTATPVARGQCSLDLHRERTQELKRTFGHLLPRKYSLQLDETPLD